MKHKNIASLNSEDLKKEIQNNEKEIRTITFSVAGVANKNTKARRNARVAIARAKTALRAQLG